MTRRELFAALPAAALAAAPAPLRLGGPIFLRSEDPAALAREHRRLGYTAAYCPPVELKDTARIRAIEKAYAAEGVIIAEVGAWKNLLDSDAARRKENYTYVEQRLALAEEIGARCCVDIAGSFNPEVWYGPHPENLSPRFLEATVENVRKLLDAVKPKRTRFTVEIMGWSIPDTADSYLKLLKAVDRPAFGVHVDVCNAVNSPGKFYDNAALSTEIFRKLGRWVLSCHAKDLNFLPEMNVHFVEVVPGRGKLDYAAYLRGIQTYAPAAPLMLEHLKTAEEYAEGAAHIRKVAQSAGIALAS